MAISIQYNTIQYNTIQYNTIQYNGETRNPEFYLVAFSTISRLSNGYPVLVEVEVEDAGQIYFITVADRVNL